MDRSRIAAGSLRREERGWEGWIVGSSRGRYVTRVTQRARRCAGVLGILLACSVVPPARADEIALPAPGSPTWRSLEFPRIERHTAYGVEADERALRARSACAASGLLLPLDDIDLRQTPRLRWRWRIPQPIETARDERSKAGDDFAARVYVAFAFEPERASLFERARRRLGAALYGEQLPGSALAYVWSRAEPAGASWENPFVASSRMISRGMGPLPDWRVEEVDLLADYTRFFGTEAPAALFLAVMTDTDETCSEAEALYADFWLLGRGGAPR
ncbi:MAG: DUF3047 domain-containing protein [Myxococcales bacterium]|nr:DUF3047 domain-containing protein [Myxococcales bacterium]MDH5306633.1 DUF3047 domain-containing protein [Myxococcales bacterium]MDH5565233.1 DUF3047 domain-containing protein [Myxococcales bacterium]